MKSKQRSFTSANNSKNLITGPNSSTKRKNSQRKFYRINTSFSEYYPPIALTMPKGNIASHMGNLKTKEELYEENYKLKNSIKKLKKEIENYKTNLFKKEIELDKKEKIINDCNKENVTEIEHKNNLNKAKESSLLTLCKQKYNELQKKYEEKCDENKLLLANIKLTKLKEYQIQIDSYKKEMQKLIQLYSYSQQKLDNKIKEINSYQEIKNEYMNQHSLIKVLKNKNEELNKKINILEQENNFLKKEAEKNQKNQNKLKQKNIKLKLSKEKFLKLKKIQDGSLLINKDNIKKLQNLQKNLEEYKSLYYQKDEECKRLLQNNTKKNNNDYINPSLININSLKFENSKIIEKKPEDNQAELYKSLLSDEKIKNNIFILYLKQQGLNPEDILKLNGYNGVINKDSNKKYKIEKNNSQNTKCCTSEGNLNFTQSNLESNLNINNKNKTSKNNINNSNKYLIQDQIKNLNNENFEIHQINELSESQNQNNEKLTESQNSEFFIQEQQKKDEQFLALSHTFIKNFEANHITKDAFINKIKEISMIFQNKKEISKEDFIKPFVNCFVEMMKVKDDKDVLIINEFFENLIEDIEGDTNRFFYELMDISDNIVDYTLVKNEQEVLNTLAIELMPFKAKLKLYLKNNENNLINFESFKKILNELNIKLSDDYMEYLLYKMKEKVPQNCSIFDLNFEIILEILERNVALNNENEINTQISEIFKELKQGLNDNKTDFEAECKNMVKTFTYKDNKNIQGIDKEEFFNIFNKYKISIDENIKAAILESFKMDKDNFESSQNELANLIDYDKICSFLKNI